MAAQNPEDGLKLHIFDQLLGRPPRARLSIKPQNVGSNNRGAVGITRTEEYTVQ
jgi:hypothetical protein